MDITEILKSRISDSIYAEEAINFSALARDVLESNPQITLSHRSIRLKASNLYNELLEELEDGHDPTDVIENGGQLTTKITPNARQHTYKGERPITSEEDALNFFEVDRAKWQVKEALFNAWDVTSKVFGKRTNYQAKIVLKPIEEKQEPFDYKKVVEYLYNCRVSKGIPDLKKNLHSYNGVGVVAISDLHMGAKTTKKQGVINTKDFSIDKLKSYLDDIAREVNSKNFQEVHLPIIGDIVESITGLNHINSWQGMDENSWGGSAMIGVYEILRNFLLQIKNLKKVYMVSGNHDRLTSRNDEDVKGEAAKVVAYMLARDFEVDYHPMVLTRVIDGICYVMTHGHFRFSKQTMSKVLYDYGKQGMYNVILTGHFHTRRVKKPISLLEKEEESIILDSVNYRAITLPAIFPGNFYSESLGFTSFPGFGIFYATMRKDNVYHLDCPLS